MSIVSICILDWSAGAKCARWLMTILAYRKALASLRSVVPKVAVLALTPMQGRPATNCVAWHSGASATEMPSGQHRSCVCRVFFRMQSMLLSLEVRVFGTVGTKQKLGKDQSMSTPSCLDTSMPKHWQRENGSASVLFTKFGWIHGAKWEFTLSQWVLRLSAIKNQTQVTQASLCSKVANSVFTNEEAKPSIPVRKPTKKASAEFPHREQSSQSEMWLVFLSCCRSVIAKGLRQRCPGCSNLRRRSCHEANLNGLVLLGKSTGNHGFYHQI